MRGRKGKSSYIPLSTFLAVFQRDKKEEEEEGTMGMRGRERRGGALIRIFKKTERREGGGCRGLSSIGGGGYKDGVGPLLGSSRARVAFMTTRAF